VAVQPANVLDDETAVDGTLVVRAAGGDDGAFRMLVDRHRARIAKAGPAGIGEGDPGLATEQLLSLVVRAAKEKHQPPVRRDADLRIAKIDTRLDDSGDRAPVLSVFARNDPDRAVVPLPARNVTGPLPKRAVESTIELDQIGKGAVRRLIPDSIDGEKVFLTGGLLRLPCQGSDQEQPEQAHD